MIDKPEAVMDYYNASLSVASDKDNITQASLPDGGIRTISGTGEASVEKITMLNSSGEEATIFSPNESVTINFKVSVYDYIENLVLGFSIKNRLGQVIYGTNTCLKNQPLLNVCSGEEYLFSVNFNLSVGVGNYSIQTALVDSENHIDKNFEWIDLAHTFQVTSSSKSDFNGYCYLDTNIEINKI